MRSVQLYTPEPAPGWLPWGLLVPVLCLLFVAIPDVGGGMLMRRVGLLDATWQPVGLLGLVTFLVVPFAATGLAVLAWVRWVERRSLASIGLPRAEALPRFLRGLGVGVATSSVVVVAIWMAGGYEAQGYARAFASLVTLLHMAILLLSFVVQAGVEEILFRGWMMSAIARKFNVVAAVAITCLVFAALHYGPRTPWNDVLMSVLFSLFACLWALRAGSLWGVMGWHAGWNWLLAVGFEVPVTGLDAHLPALLVKLVPQGSRYLNGGSEGPEGSLLCSLFFLLASVWWLWRHRSQSATR